MATSGKLLKKKALTMLKFVPNILHKTDTVQIKSQTTRGETNRGKQANESETQSCAIGLKPLLSSKQGRLSPNPWLVAFCLYGLLCTGAAFHLKT